MAPYRQIIGCRDHELWERRVFLALAVGDNKQFRLFQAIPERLAQSVAYFNAAKGEYDLPAEINGEPVAGVDGDFVVGGALNWRDPDDGIEFDDVADEKIGQWLSENDWTNTDLRENLRIGVERVAQLAKDHPNEPYYLNEFEDWGETKWNWQKTETGHHSQDFASKEEALEAWRNGTIEFQLPPE